ncbi:hypothetical protein ACWGJ2_28265 [Streptomyces sp. NPDC054796]
MTARVYPAPSATTPSAASPTASSAASGAQTRLPWWAVALPVVAFVMLLALLLGGGEAGAAEQAGPLLQPFSAILQGLIRVLFG